MSELGARYKCYKCENKFYDLNRPQPICPTCGEDQNNKEVKPVYTRKKRHMASRMGADMHAASHEISDYGEGPAEPAEDASLNEDGEEEKKDDEYNLDAEDIAIDERTGINVSV